MSFSAILIFSKSLRGTTGEFSTKNKSYPTTLKYIQINVSSLGNLKCKIYLNRLVSYHNENQLNINRILSILLFSKNLVFE